jgi:hypothetical protein
VSAIIDYNEFFTPDQGKALRKVYRAVNQAKFSRFKVMVLGLQIAVSALAENADADVVGEVLPTFGDIINNLLNQYQPGAVRVITKRIEPTEQAALY